MKHVLSDEPVTKEEVDIAKSSAGNSFVFNFASKQQHLSRILVYHVLGLPQVKKSACTMVPLIPSSCRSANSDLPE